MPPSSVLFLIWCPKELSWSCQHAFSAAVADRGFSFLVGCHVAVSRAGKNVKSRQPRILTYLSRGCFAVGYRKRSERVIVELFLEGPGSIWRRTFAEKINCKHGSSWLRTSRHRKVGRRPIVSDLECVYCEPKKATVNYNPIVWELTSAFQALVA